MEAIGNLVYTYTIYLSEREREELVEAFALVRRKQADTSIITRFEDMLIMVASNTHTVTPEEK